MQQLKILHNTTTVGKTSYGIGQISVSLARAQYLLGNNVRIWSLDTDDNISWASTNHDFPSSRITGFKLNYLPSLWISTEITKCAHKSTKSMFDVVHQHGIWTGASTATLILAKEKGIPTVIAPHGSLNQWALNLSRYKKRIALTFYEGENLKLASCLHATSENEITDFRRFGLKNPIAYIQNGIQEKYLTKSGNSSKFRELNDIPTNKRILLFLSRITPKKGLTMLINAISSIRADFEKWQLIIAGNDEFDHKKEIEALIDQLNLGDKIKIIGPLFDQLKLDAFAASELFILPSYSEGSPMVVLDSLAAGVPVITTKASSWSDLNEYNSGWWTDIDTHAIAVALKKAVTMSTEDLKQMGENARELIALKFTWPQLADKTIQLYNWLLGCRERPEFVVLD